MIGQIKYPPDVASVIFLFCFYLVVPKRFKRGEPELAR